MAFVKHDFWRRLPLTGRGKGYYRIDMAESAKKDMAEFVPMAKEAVARILSDGRDDVAERMASKVLESEGYLQTKPTNVTTNKNLIMQLDGKGVSTILRRMGQVFGEGEEIAQDVDFQVEESVERVTQRKKRLIDVVLEGENGQTDRGVLPEGPSKARRDAGDGEGHGKVARKSRKKAQE